MNTPNFFAFLRIVAIVVLLLPISSAYGSELVIDTIQDDGRIVANVNLGNYTRHLALASFWLEFNPNVVKYEGYNKTLDGYGYTIMDDSVNLGLIKIIIQHVNPPLLSNPNLIRVNFKGTNASAAGIGIKKVEMIRDFYGFTIYGTRRDISFNQVYMPSSQKLAEQKIFDGRYANVLIGSGLKNGDEKNSNLGYDKTLKENTKMNSKNINNDIDATSDIGTISASERIELADKFKLDKPYGNVFLLLSGLVAFCLVFYIVIKIRR